MLNSVSSAKGYDFSAVKNEIHGPIPQRGKTLESNLRSCTCVMANINLQLHKMKNQKQNFRDDNDGELFGIMHWPLRSFIFHVPKALSGVFFVTSVNPNNDVGIMSFFAMYLINNFYRTILLGWGGE